MRRAAAVSGTRISSSGTAPSGWKRSETTASTAPPRAASETKEWPSWTSPTRAIEPRPGVTAQEVADQVAEVEPRAGQGLEAATQKGGEKVGWEHRRMVAQSGGLRTAGVRP